MRHAVAAAIVLVIAAGCGSGRPASRVATTHAAPAFADRVQGACLQRNNELRQLSRPRNKTELAGYVVSMLSIVRYYRGQLAALHPSHGRQYFARYTRLLRVDESSAVALLIAVRRGDRRAVTRLLTGQQARSALEQALLKRLGASC
jgi:hypothetical protein